MNAGDSRGIRAFWRIDAVGLAILVGVTLIAYAVQVQPLVRSRRSMTAQQADLAAQQRKATELRGTVQSLKNQLTADQQVLAQESLELQPASQLNQQIGRLTDLAIEDGIQIDAVEPGKTTSGARYATIGVRVSGFGSYRNCAKYIRHISERFRDSSVSKIQLSTQASATPNSASFSLDLTWYTAPEALSTTR
ncbi:MAG: type 4a pilus biogenesis protein PilO [Bacillota bacterium]